ncbi:MAG TPA: cyclic pyranopterin monophosphate synthase MoaC [Polyangiaceae bacterium]|nr:cyclic pyranopterin monophosphate synthase MoaC [Polyangiaceae bacterium]
MDGVFGFEDIDDALPLLPLAARRALDVAGLKLSLSAWQGLGLEARRALVVAGSGNVVDVAAVREAVTGADPAPSARAADDEARLADPPASLRARLGEHWPALSPLARFAVAHLEKRGNSARLEEALAELLPDSPVLTHLDEKGQARMVDVGEKAITHRRAVARGNVIMAPATARLVADGAGPKGDVLAVARVAGIMAAKKTPELIPLCHGIALHRVAVTFDVDTDAGRIAIEAVAEARDRTGVEMEAMVAASVAALTIYDMLKAVERGIVITEVVLQEKSGGRSGHYLRAAPTTEEST